MHQEIIKQIKNNYTGEVTESIIINGKNYAFNCQWKKHIHIIFSPKNLLITETNFSEIKKLVFTSIIFRSPQYSLRGNKTILTEKLLSNQYTRALLYFRDSKITCQNNQIIYSARLRKKDSAQLETIISYFKELLNSLN
ncbi:hypothetical protein KCTC32420_00085 [Aequorivita nionensis]|jgi:hypothetical protein